MINNQRRIHLCYPSSNDCSELDCLYITLLSKTEYINPIKFTIIHTLDPKRLELLRPRTTLILRQTPPIPLPKPFTHFPFVPNLIVRPVVPLIQLSIVPFHVLGHIAANVTFLIDIGRFPTRAEGWSCFVGGLLFVV